MIEGGKENFIFNKLNLIRFLLILLIFKYIMVNDFLDICI